MSQGSRYLMFSMLYLIAGRVSKGHFEVIFPSVSIVFGLSGIYRILVKGDEL